MDSLHNTRETKMEVKSHIETWRFRLSDSVDSHISITMEIERTR